LTDRQYVCEIWILNWENIIVCVLLCEGVCEDIISNVCEVINEGNEEIIEYYCEYYSMCEETLLWKANYYCNEILNDSQLLFIIIIIDINNEDRIIIED